MSNVIELKFSIRPLICLLEIIVFVERGEELHQMLIAIVLFNFTLFSLSFILCGVLDATAIAVYQGP